MRWFPIFFLLLLVACGDDAPQNEPADQEPEDLPESKLDAADQTNQGKGDFSLDICKARNWYNDGECDWFCPKRDEDCNADPLGPDPQGDPAQYPIVLAHGFMGSPTSIWAFLNVKEALEADGHIVYEGEVPPFHSPQVRAEQLAPTVDRALAESGADKVNIIAHSMGGVDSRYLISTMGYGDRVASLTTISSPHRGTNIADATLSLTPSIADKALDALLEAIGTKFSNAGDEADLRASLGGISEENMPQFNIDNPNDERVFYQSWAGLSSISGFRNSRASDRCDGMMMLHPGTYDHMNPLLWLVAPVVAGVTSPEPNDGMANVESAKWGQFNGCIPGDHFDEVGQLDGEPDPDTGFDHIRFYRNVAYGLAERGF